MHEHPFLFAFFVLPTVVMVPVAIVRAFMPSKKNDDDDLPPPLFAQ